MSSDVKVTASHSVPENRVTEIGFNASVEEMDKHMEAMNKEGFDLVYVQNPVISNLSYGAYIKTDGTPYRLFWKRVNWPQ